MVILTLAFSSEAPELSHEEIQRLIDEFAHEFAAQEQLQQRPPRE
jgi:hypothetical protein